MAVRAVAGDVVLSGELGDFGHLFDAVVVFETEVGDAVARRRRHGFLASGVALVLRSVPVRAVIDAGPSEAACSGSALGVFFSRQVLTASELANALSPSNEDLRVVTHTRSLLQTAPRTGHFAKK